MLYSYFFNMLKVGVPGATQVPQLLVYNLLSLYASGFFRKHIFYKNLLFSVDIFREPVYNSLCNYSANVVIS